MFENNFWQSNRGMDKGVNKIKCAVNRIQLPAVIYDGVKLSAFVSIYCPSLRIAELNTNWTHVVIFVFDVFILLFLSRLSFQQPVSSLLGKCTSKRVYTFVLACLIVIANYLRFDCCLCKYFYDISHDRG